MSVAVAIQGIADDPLVYLNGELLPLSGAKISVLDRGFIFGDGVYEVVPVYARQPFYWPQHLARLGRSLAAVRINNPHDDAQWTAIVQRLIDSQALDDQFIYLQVSRGVAKRDHAMPPGLSPTVFAMTQALSRPTTAQRQQGVTAVRMKDARWQHCDIKSISLLGNVLARQYAIDHEAFEVLQFRDGYLTEGALSNIWMVRDQQLCAPPRSAFVLEGVRYGLMETLCAELGIALGFRPITEAEVAQADELMLTSATKEVLPIVSLDGSPVGAGVPGPFYNRLRAAYDQAISLLKTNASAMTALSANPSLSAIAEQKP